MFTLSNILQNLSPFKEDTPQFEKAARTVVLNQTISLREEPQFHLGPFKKMEFDPLVKWPTAGSSATTREKEIVDLAMKYTHKHTLGLYNEVLEDYDRRGWISEHMVLFDPKTRIYLGKPGNLFDEMEEVSRKLTPNENRLFNETLSMPNRVKNIPEDFVREADEGFDYTHVKEILAPVREYFATQKGQPQEFMLEGVKYPSTYFKTPGVQPNNRDMPAAFKKRFAFHAALSILKDAHHLAVDPEGRERSQGRFEVDKSDGRKAQWHRKMSTDETPLDLEHQQKIIDAGILKLTIPKYEPILPENAFRTINLPVGTKKDACLIDLPNQNGKQPLQVLAAVAVHPQNNRCLMEYEDYSIESMPLRYAVSKDEPMFGDNSEKLVGIFDNKDQALACWEGQERNLKHGSSPQNTLSAGDRARELERQQGRSRSPHSTLLIENGSPANVHASVPMKKTPSQQSLEKKNHGRGS